MPCTISRLKIQIWDKDLTNPNDAIAEANVSLKGMLSRAYRAKTGSELDKQWIKMTHPNFEGVQGRVELTIQILTDSEAKGKAAGSGREEPNQYPELTVPHRPSTSYPPWRLDRKFSNFLWQYKWRIAIVAAATALGYILLYFTLGAGGQSSQK